METFVRLLLILFANKTHCSGMGGGSPTLRTLATISYFIFSSHSLLSPNACLYQVLSAFDLPRSGKELCSRSQGGRKVCVSWARILPLHLALSCLLELVQLSMYNLYNFQLERPLELDWKMPPFSTNHIP